MHSVPLRHAFATATPVVNVLGQEPLAYMLATREKPMQTTLMRMLGILRTLIVLWTLVMVLMLIVANRERRWSVMKWIAVIIASGETLMPTTLILHTF